MHCVKCSHHFCWLCQKPCEWLCSPVFPSSASLCAALPGSGHTNYYDCNTYVENKSKGILSEAETKQIETNKFLQKFTFFKNRYDHNALSVRLCGKLIDKIGAAEKKGEVGPCDWLREVVANLKVRHKVHVASRACLP